MNSFISHNKQFFSLLLGLLLNSCLHAITFNNQPLKDILRPGNAILMKDLEKDSLVILEMENGNFNLYVKHIHEAEKLKEVFDYVVENRTGSSWASKFLDLSSNTSNYNSSCFVGREHISFKVKTSFDCTRCFFESPLIYITANALNFHDCFFINPQILNIIAECPQSDCEFIQIIFHDQSENPTLIIGEIDFKDKETTKQLAVSNVKEIRLQFNAHVWAENPSEDPRSADVAARNLDVASTSAEEDKSVSTDLNTEEVAPADLNQQPTSVPFSDDESLSENSHSEDLVEISSDPAPISTSIEENKIVRTDVKPKVVAPVKVNRKPSFVPTGFVERSIAAIVAFSEKYLRPYL